MRRARLFLVTLAVSGCAATPAPEPEPPSTPVVDVNADDASGHADERRTAREAKQRTRTKAQQIARALAEIDVQTIGALGGGQTVAGVLSDSEVPPGLLDEAAGVMTADSSAGLKLGGGAGAAAGGGSIATIGGTAAGSAGKATVQGPKGTASLTASVTQGKVANATSVVARMRGRFRRCYQQGLNSDPTMAGTLTLVASIGPNGEVLSVAGGTTTSLKAVVPCFKAVISGGMFAPPDGGSAEVSVEATLAPAP